MKILWTSHALDQPAGTETFTRDVVGELLRRGHEVQLLTAKKGRIAEELVQTGAEVHTDPRLIKGEFDLIHGQHFLESLAAMGAFPDTPALVFSHGGIARDWIEWPAEFHPMAGRIVTTCSNLASFLRRTLKQADREIGIVGNSVDLQRFESIRSLPEKPARAAFFHNSMTVVNAWWQAAAEACQNCGVALDSIGAGFENRQPHPENFLPQYDLVFASGRSAIEAIASGCAVIIMGPGRSGGMATPQNMLSLEASNFTCTSLDLPLSATRLAHEIRQFNPADAAMLTASIRLSHSISAITDCMESEYDLLLNNPPAPSDAFTKSRTLAAGLQIAAKQMFESIAADQRRLQAEEVLAETQQALKLAHLKIEIAEKVLRRGWIRWPAHKAVARHWSRLQSENESIQP